MYLNGAFSGQAAPGGGEYRFFDEVVIGGERELVFSGEARLAPGSDDIRRVWNGTLAANSLLVKAQTMAPGTPGKFLNFSALAVNSIGQAAFLSRTDSLSSEKFIFAQDASGVVLGLSDQTSPFSAGSLQFVDAGNPAYSTSGVLAAKVTLTDPEDSLSNLSALLIGQPGNMEFALTEGDPVPDPARFPKATDVGSLFSSSVNSFGSGTDLAMNDAGQLVFLGEAVNSSIEFRRSVMFAGSPAGLQALAIEFDDAPGSSGSYSFFAPDPAISSNGISAFVAEDYDFEDSTSIYRLGLFSGTPGNVTRLFSDGDAAPGGGAGIVLTNLSSPAINARGDVVFKASILYPNFESRPSLWLKRAGEEPVLLVAQGNVFSTPTGPAAVTDINFAGHGAFNDLNQVVFILQLANGEGVYIADTRSGYPVVSISSPSRRAEQVVARPSTTIAGTATDATGVDRVEYRVTARGQTKKRKNGKKRRRAHRVITGTVDVAADGTWSFQAPLLMGRNLISVLAVDQLENASPATQFTVIRWRGRQSASRGEYRRLKRRVQTPQ